MRRLAVTCAALALLTVSATASSSASAEKLTLSDGGTALKAGNTFWLFGPENLFVTANGLQCESSSQTEVFVSVLENTKARDRLQVIGIEDGALPAHCRSFT